MGSEAMQRSELDPIVERAAKMQAPILQHTWLKVGGNGPGESTPFDFVELAKRHPSASLICGHTGGDWERGIRIVRSTPNVCVELAGSDPTSDRKSDPADWNGRPPLAVYPSSEVILSRHRAASGRRHLRRCLRRQRRLAGPDRP